MREFTYRHGGCRWQLTQQVLGPDFVLYIRTGPRELWSTVLPAAFIYGIADTFKGAGMFVPDTDEVARLCRNMTERDGRWVPARPAPGPFITEMKRRLKGMWLVLTNRATTVRWY